MRHHSNSIHYMWGGYSQMKYSRFLSAILVSISLMPLGILQAETPYGDSDLLMPPVPPSIRGTAPSDGIGVSPIVSSASSNEISLDSTLADSTIGGYENFAGEGCGDCSDCCYNSWLFQYFAHGDRCYSEYISPMTNPVFFEDPRTLSELRFIFLHQTINPAVNAGNSYQLYAMQIRAALNDRLSIVAAKDGFITIDSPLANDGWSDISLGLKYNLFADPDTRQLLSAGVSYEIPLGSTRTLQGNGGGEFHFYMSGATPIGCDWRWVSGTGFRIPTHNTAESQMWYWSNHFDRNIINNDWYIFGETNWYQWIRSGSNAGLAGIEGGDLINLGSTNVAGNAIVTGAIGLKYKPNDCMEVGIAWEAPLTNRRDLLDNRLTLDWILRY